MDLYNISAGPLNVTITPPSHKLTLIPWYHQIFSWCPNFPGCLINIFWQLVCIGQDPDIHTLHLFAMSLKFLLTFKYLPSPIPFLFFFLVIYLLEKLDHLSWVSFSMFFCTQYLDLGLFRGAEYFKAGARCTPTIRHITSAYLSFWDFGSPWWPLPRSISLEVATWWLSSLPYLPTGYFYKIFPV